jgi:hypothetical protein
LSSNGPVAFHLLWLIVGLLITHLPGHSQAQAQEPNRQNRVARDPLPRLFLIEPGAQISDRPPQGWRYLLLKSVPRLASGDLKSLPSWAAETAALYRTAMVVDVRRSVEHPERYVLRRVGVGLCVPTGRGYDVVVRSGKLDSSGVKLSMVERQILAAAEVELKRSRLIATTPTFVLLRAPATLAVGTEHQKIDLYYAIWVDPRNAQLHAVVWMKPANSPSSLSELRVLTGLGSSLIFDCPLDVQATRIAGLVPVSWSFAMCTLPPGRTCPVPEQLTPLLNDATQGRADPPTLEGALAQLIEESEENRPINRSVESNRKLRFRDFSVGRTAGRSVP